MLLFHSWVADLYGLPESLVLLIGTANVAYAAYSFSLAVRSVRALNLIRLLSLANITWAAACLWWALEFWESATVFGITHLVGEALLVGGLGCLEWRWQQRLTTTQA